MEVLFKNPLTVWLRWLFKWTIYKLKYAGKNLRMEYLCEINNCDFSNFNTVYKNSRVRDCHFGSYSYVGRESQVYSANVGSFTSIGPQVLIGLGEHPSKNFISTHPMFYSTLGQSNPVIVEKNLYDEFPQTAIGHDVWVGARSMIKSGISVGNGAIIAAGSVVVKDVEPYSIVGGVPAKHIRYRFNEEQITFLLDSRWWENDLSWLKQNKDHFMDIGLLNQFQKQ